MKMLNTNVHTHILLYIQSTGLRSTPAKTPAAMHQSKPLHKQQIH